MENSTEYYFELITNYFAGEITEKEMEILSVWINLSAENRTIFNDYSKTLSLISKTKTEEINIDAEWKNLESKIDFSSTKEFKTQLTEFNNKKSFRFLKIAASLALIAVASYFLYFYSGKSDLKQLVAQNKTVECVLPDNTQITLNNGTIEYNEDFKTRKINLNGEAFFNVTHDEKNTFSIEAGDIIVEDIGTSFYVNTISANNKITIILKEGKVALYNKNIPTEKYFLEPGEKAEYSIIDKTFTKSLNNDKNYIAWKTKELVFNDNTLIDIVPILNNVYHSNISLKNKDLNNCKITAEFKNQSLESVLKVLKETLNLTITKSDTGIELSGNGCK